MSLNGSNTSKPRPTNFLYQALMSELIDVRPSRGGANTQSTDYSILNDVLGWGVIFGDCNVPNCANSGTGVITITPFTLIRKEPGCIERTTTAFRLNHSLFLIRFQ